MAAAERLHVETLKLLLQVVFADHRASTEEIAVVMSLARGLETPEEFQVELLGCLRFHAPLPAPDLELLRRYREGVVATASLLARSDGLKCPDEKELLGTLEQLLS